MRKNIDLPDSSVEVLDWLAEKDGRPTKNYIERILIGWANDHEGAFKKLSSALKSKSNKSNKSVKK